MSLLTGQRFVFDTAGAFADVTPTVVALYPTSSTTATLVFSTAMVMYSGDGRDVLTLSNYTASAPLSLLTVTPLTPSRVQLRYRETRAGQSYTVNLAATLASRYGRLLDAASTTKSFVALGLPPRVLAVQTATRSDGTALRLDFSEPLDPTSLAAASYVISRDDGGSPTSVATNPSGGPDSTMPTQISLTLAPPMLPGVAYHLALSGVTDSVGNPVNPARLPFVGFVVVPRPQLISATATAPSRVALVLSDALVADAASLSPHSYSFDGALRCVGVQFDPNDPTRVWCDTTAQQGAGKRYTVRLSPLLQNAAGTTVDPGQSATSFFGMAPAPAALVTELRAQGHPDGNQIDLWWQNPPGTVHNQITRRIGGTPQSLADGHSVYVGPPIESFSDTALADTTFYSYLVAASTDGVTFATDPQQSQTEALSIKSLQSAQYIWDRYIPAVYKDADAQAERGVMWPVVQVLGGCVDLLRGELQAAAYSQNPDRSAPSVLRAQNAGLGLVGEATFDAQSLRRLPLHILSIWQKSGTLPALLSLVRVLCQWEADVLVYGGNSLGAVFRLYDGETMVQSASGTTPQIDAQRGRLTDSAQSLTPHLYVGGRLFDAFGNTVAIADNDATGFTWNIAAAPQTQTTAPAQAGDTALSVQSVAGLPPGRHVMLVTPTLNLVTRIAYSVGATSLSLQTPLPLAVPIGAELYAQPDILQAEETGQGTGAQGMWTDPQKAWTPHQFQGFVLLDGTAARFVVNDNDAQNLYLQAGTPQSGAYALAPDFAPAASFAARKPIWRYSAAVGNQSYLFDPARDLSEQGGPNDPFSPLYAGDDNLREGFTPDDIAIFVRPGVALATGHSQSLDGARLTDPKQALTPGALKGCLLNPNRKTQALVPIRDNDATSITCNQTLVPLCQPGDPYFVLRPQDAVRYTRLGQLLPSFVSRFANTMIFFT